MSRLISVLCLVVALLSMSGYSGDADPYFDRPQPGEDFTHFFARITHGGLFQGIRLTAPKRFEDAFYPAIWRPTWQGKVNQARRALESQGVNLWGDWYQVKKVLPILAPDTATRTELARALRVTEALDPNCATLCRDFDTLSRSDWADSNVQERQALTRAFVTQAAIFGGQTLLEYLALEHAGSATEVLNHVEFKLLDTARFEKAVREIGWEGPVYFRGITAPAPGDPKSRWILLNDDLMRKMTAFDQPLLQMLEYAGILTHELSHVFQDQAAAKQGIDLMIKSAEGVLLLEGEAEYLAESALLAAARSQNIPSALGLFVAEQADEVVNRPGQETQGNLFPYTVGLPFASALFGLTRSDDERAALRREIYRTIDDQQSLSEMLARLFP